MTTVQTAAKAPPHTGLAAGHATRALWLLAALAALAAATALSLMVGAKAISPAVIADALFAGGTGNDAAILHELRVPRTILAVLVGVALGLSGAMIQALTRNPLADPGILGVNAGAAVAVVIGVAVFEVTSIREYLWFGFAGAVVVTVIVYVVGSRGRGGATPLRLTLAGLAIGAVAQGVSSGITLLNPKAFDAMRFWGAGNIANRPAETILTVLPFIAAGTVLALVAARSLNATALGDDLARSLGAHVGRTRVIVVVAVTLLCGAATAAAGPIGFVGLMVPHVVRWLVGPDQRWILPFTLVTAPILLLLSDVLGRVVLPGGELQVGIVTAFVGAPVLVWLVRRSGASGL
ncbi:iron chelate uptake ABC transporter family permease subunit [Phytomonospora sp. NPDC050363]|uniref:iron chelate uptake ABC transporter family permease subunit n=1 Tax=Phytomonospora sp. NPDC050363 TaxID=3155642 RepID=UPI0033FDBB06